MGKVSGTVAGTVPGTVIYAKKTTRHCSNIYLKIYDFIATRLPVTVYFYKPSIL